MNLDLDILPFNFFISPYNFFILLYNFFILLYKEDILLLDFYIIHKNTVFYTQKNRFFD